MQVTQLTKEPSNVFFLPIFQRQNLIVFNSLYKTNKQGYIVFPPTRAKRPSFPKRAPLFYLFDDLSLSLKRIELISKGNEAEIATNKE